MVQALYKKLLRLYLRGFRERKQGTKNGLSGFVLWAFLETGTGILREHSSILRQGDTMKNILANPNSAAVTGLILAMPLGFTYIVLMFEIEPLARLLNNLFTIEGQINMLGRIVIYGGLLLLPVAFALNLQSMLKTEGSEAKRRFYTLNLVVGAAILLLILFTWGDLILEEIYCLRGIRCD
jgi:hypothetical protein